MATNTLRQVIPVSERIVQSQYSVGDGCKNCREDPNGICYCPAYGDISFTAEEPCAGSDDNGSQGKCNRTCNKGGLVYDAFFINQDKGCGTATGRIVNTSCIMPSKSTCTYLFSDQDKLYDVPQMSNVPEHYYNECTGAQQTWFQRPFNTLPAQANNGYYSNDQETNVPGSTCPLNCDGYIKNGPSAIGGQVCNFDKRKFTTLTDILEYEQNYRLPRQNNSVGGTRYNLEFGGVEDNLDDLYLNFCQQQVTGECRNGSDRCSRYFAASDEGDACRNWIAAKAAEDPTKGSYLYDTLAQNYCIRYPESSECQCLGRNQYASSYSALKSGNPYNDGCWWTGCKSLQSAFVTEDVNVTDASEAKQTASCPACFCTQAFLFYNDTSVTIEDLEGDMNCEISGSVCS